MLLRYGSLAAQFPHAEHSSVELLWTVCKILLLQDFVDVNISWKQRDNVSENKRIRSEGSLVLILLKLNTF